MIYIDLILNLSLLVTLSVFSGIIDKYRPRSIWWGGALQGALFGLTSVLVMLRPMNIAPGLIFDGRSIVVSLCALFFGPLAAVVAAGIAAAGRIFIGGPGMITGILVITASAGIGYLARLRSSPEIEIPSVGRLYFFGIAVHVAMLAIMFTLPRGLGLSVVRQIGPAVMIFYPLATVLAGKILADQILIAGSRVALQSSEKRLIQEQRMAEQDDFTRNAALKEIEDKFRHVFEAANVGKSITLPTGEIFPNKAFADMLGYSREELVNKHWQELTPPEEIEGIQAILATLRTGEKDSVRFNKRYFHRDGSFVWTDVSAVMQRDKAGKPLYIIATIMDITERKKTEEALNDSKTLLMALIRSIPDLIWLKDTQGKYLACNYRFESFFGAKEKDIIGKTDYDFVDKDLADSFREHDKAALARGRASKNEEEVVFADDGHREILETIKTPMYTSDGRLAGVIGIGRDITRRKKNEEALRESKDRFERAFENIPDVVVIYDTDLRIRYINKATTRITGRPESDFIGRRDEEIWPPEIYGRYMPTLLEALKTGTTQSIEAEILISEDMIRYLHITCVPLLGEKGQVKEILGITHDLTEDKKKEAERMELEAILRRTQKMESIGNLAGGIAHDFNNILSSIIGFTELTLEEVDKTSLIADNLQEVYAAGKRAKELVGQILTFARQAEQAIKPVQVDILIKEVLRFIRSSIPVTIEIRQEIESDSLILGNPTQVHQVLMNLFTNAAYAMEDKGGILWVRLKDVAVDGREAGQRLNLKEGNYLELKVSDTGAGIAPDHIDSIFEPYFTTKGQGEGTGLGLAVVHGIVESYGGKIRVDSTLGKGTCFTLYLPIIKTRKKNFTYEPEASPTGRERILFVDDEVPIARIGEKILGHLGYAVTIMTSSMEALELFRSKPDAFDLVVTDMTMPRMTGDILACELMKIRPDIPIILCTGYSRKLSVEAALEKGIKALAYKPIVKSELAIIVRKVLDAEQPETMASAGEDG